MKTRAPKGGYDFDEKRSYREWVWRLFKRRGWRALKRSRCLLMPSSSMLEIETARRHGAIDANMIAVDDNVANLATIRRLGYGGRSITADVGEAFRTDLGRLDCVHLDLTSCWSQKLSSLLETVGSYPFSDGAIIVVNTMRGRETRNSRDDMAEHLASFLDGSNNADGVNRALGTIENDIDVGDAARTSSVIAALTRGRLGTGASTFFFYEDAFRYHGGRVTMFASAFRFSHEHHNSVGIPRRRLVRFSHSLHGLHRSSYRRSW